MALFSLLFIFCLFVWISMKSNNFLKAKLASQTYFNWIGCRCCCRWHLRHLFASITVLIVPCRLPFEAKHGEEAQAFAKRDTIRILFSWKIKWKNWNKWMGAMTRESKKSKKWPFHSGKCQAERGKNTSKEHTFWMDKNNHGTDCLRHKKSEIQAFGSETSPKIILLRSFSIIYERVFMLYTDKICQLELNAQGNFCWIFCPLSDLWHTNEYRNQIIDQMYLCVVGCCYYYGKGRPSKIGNIACSRWMGYDLRIKNEVSFTSKLRPLFIIYKFYVFKSKIQMMWVRKNAFSCLQCKFQFQYCFNPTNYPFTFALIIFSGSIHKMIIQ